jgi:DNA primase
MPRWGEEIIGQVKEGNDIVDTLAQYLALNRAGANYKGLCPFHQEKTPSFMVSPARQMWHCFGCGEGGDVIRFVMRFEGLPFVEAVRKLAARAGVDLPEQADPSTGSGHDDRAPLYRANRLAEGFYRETLARGEGGMKAREYLSARGIHAEVCRAFGVGYAPPGWHPLAEALAGEGVTPEILVASGLAVPGEKGKKPYDRFRDRVVFPIRDLSGRVLGFGGRTMDPEGTPKYLNSPETAVYHKGDFLYGLDLAAPRVRAEGEVILVEGYLDVIALHQAGMANVVGVLGTALTSEQARRMRRIAPRCVLLFDGDPAGVKAALRSGLLMLEEGVECRVAPLAGGEDPDSFVRAHGVDALREVVRGALPLITFVLAEARKQDPGATVPERMKVFTAIRPYMARIKNKVELALYLEEAARALGVDAGAVRDEVLGNRTRADDPASPYPRPRPAVPRKVPRIPDEERLLVQLLLRDAGLAKVLGGDLDPAAFSGPGMSALVAAIKEGGEGVSALILEDEALSGLISRWQLSEIGFPAENHEIEARGCLRRIALRRVEAWLAEMDASLAGMEASGADRKQVNRLLEEKQRLQTRRQELKNS